MKNAATIFSGLHVRFSSFSIGRSKRKTPGSSYTIPQIDLSTKPEGVAETYQYLYDPAIIDASLDYLGHPDSILLHDGSILTVFPEGHGKGAIRSKISLDGGESYTSTIENQPSSWKNSRETPTVYRLQFRESKTADKLILISGNPKWPTESTRGGFNCSISDDEGKTWTEFQTFYDQDSEKPLIPIVAMGSLVQLKENGKFVDKWMGVFHDPDFYNYKTFLSFDENGKYHWSEPELYFGEYRALERLSKMCEVAVIRSEGGRGDELCLISRSNTKTMNSLLSFSADEGKTWSEPVEAPAALNGERHKALYTADGRLFITFRSIERDPKKIKQYKDKSNDWYSEGWVAWVGTYEDLKQGAQGQYRIKIAHTYLKDQDAPAVTANADTGYCGNVLLEDGCIVTSSYGAFGKKNAKGERITYLISKRIYLKDIDEML